MATYPHCIECGCDLMQDDELDSDLCTDCQKRREDIYSNKCMYCEQPLPKPMVLCSGCFDIQEEHILGTACPICFSEDVAYITDAGVWTCNSCYYNWSWL
jgi:hypothetical protein